MTGPQLPDLNIWGIEGGCGSRASFAGHAQSVPASKIQGFCSGAQYPAPPPSVLQAGSGQFQIPERGSLAAPTEVAGIGLRGEEDPE